MAATAASSLDLGQAIRLLSEDLKCNICLGLYKKPAQLPCEHCFCRDCINRTFKDGTKSTCPLCKAPVNKRDLGACPMLERISQKYAALESILEQSILMSQPNTDMNQVLQAIQNNRLPDGTRPPRGRAAKADAAKAAGAENDGPSSSAGAAPAGKGQGKGGAGGRVGRATCSKRVRPDAAAAARVDDAQGETAGASAVGGAVTEAMPAAAATAAAPAGKRQKKGATAIATAAAAGPATSATAGAAEGAAADATGVKPAEVAPVSTLGDTPAVDAAPAARATGRGGTVRSLLPKGLVRSVVTEPGGRQKFQPPRMVSQPGDKAVPEKSAAVDKRAAALEVEVAVTDAGPAADAADEDAHAPARAPGKGGRAKQRKVAPAAVAEATPARAVAAQPSGAAQQQVNQPSSSSAGAAAGTAVAAAGAGPGSGGQPQEVEGTSVVALTPGAERRSIRLLPWACARCTYENDVTHKKCKMCKGLRPKDLGTGASPEGGQAAAVEGGEAGTSGEAAGNAVGKGSARKLTSATDAGAVAAAGKGSKGEGGSSAKERKPPAAPSARKRKSSAGPGDGADARAGSDGAGVAAAAAAKPPKPSPAPGAKARAARAGAQSAEKAPAAGSTTAAIAHTPAPAGGETKRRRSAPPMLPGPGAAGPSPQGGVTPATAAKAGSSSVVAGGGRWVQPHPEWVLIGSGLDERGKETLKLLARQSGARVVDGWDAGVTHVLCKTDDEGRARRTVKYLMGIAQGCWVLDMAWAQTCMSRGQAVGEGEFEIKQDTAGGAGGAAAGRTRANAQGALLLTGLQVYLAGPFSALDDIRKLVHAAGATLLSRPGAFDPSAHNLADDLPAGVVLVDGEECSSKRQQPAAVAKQAVDAGLVPLSYKWLLDCVGSYRAAPTEMYKL